VPLAEAEEAGVKFGTSLSAASIAALRAVDATKLLEATGGRGGPRFTPTVDGYFFPEMPTAIFAAGKQANVPLLAGWNSAEAGSGAVLGRQEATRANYEAAVRKMYAADADEVLKQYAAESDDAVKQAATDLASDRFIAYSTWKWIDVAAKTGDKPVYRYFYARPRPGSTGAAHSAEIEYAMGNLAGNKAYAWTPDDYKVSTTMQGFFANFIKTGDPNGPGLPHWPKANYEPASFMRIDVESHEEPDSHAGRYTLLDRLKQKR